MQNFRKSEKDSFIWLGGKRFSDNKEVKSSVNGCFMEDNKIYKHRLEKYAK